MKTSYTLVLLGLARPRNGEDTPRHSPLSYYHWHRISCQWCAQSSDERNVAYCIRVRAYSKVWHNRDKDTVREWRIQTVSSLPLAVVNSNLRWRRLRQTLLLLSSLWLTSLRLASIFCQFLIAFDDIFTSGVSVTSSAASFSFFLHHNQMSP